ncbi:GNAT family N-acetyltransferase [Candidatus Woesearchaeota archaeon]|nr:GNAT family N-acetyltransferase [Candidatus Woesearchaeota archaeon]
MKIRKATSKDTEKILKLWQELMDYHSNLDKTYFHMAKNAREVMKKHLRLNLGKRGSLIMAAEDKGIIVAFCFARMEKLPPVYENRNYCFIDTAYTKKEYRNKSIMKEMIQRIEKYYGGKGIKNIVLDAFHLNEKGVASWKKIGFDNLTDVLIKKIL